MEAAVRDVIKIETATEPRFQELFVAAMAFPHATAPSPHLSTVVELPVAHTRRADVARRRRRGSASKPASGRHAVTETVPGGCLT